MWSISTEVDEHGLCNNWEPSCFSLYIGRIMDTAEREGVLAVFSKDQVRVTLHKVFGNYYILYQGSQPMCVCAL